jgi:hypothetical protein
MHSVCICVCVYICACMCVWMQSHKHWAYFDVVLCLYPCMYAHVRAHVCAYVCMFTYTAYASGVRGEKNHVHMCIGIVVFILTYIHNYREDTSAWTIAADGNVYVCKSAAPVAGWTASAAMTYMCICVLYVYTCTKDPRNISVQEGLQLQCRMECVCMYPSTHTHTHTHTTG